MCIFATVFQISCFLPGEIDVPPHIFPFYPSPPFGLPSGRRNILLIFLLTCCNLIAHHVGFLAASSKSSVLDGVLGQLKMQIQFLKEPQTAQTHQRLCALVSSMSQLAGEIFFDLHDHGTAQSCYTFAATSAHEARAYDLWASALVRHSYLPIFDERYEDALPLLKQAEYIAQQGDLALPTKYWAAATYAEAESGMGNLKACQSAFERAHSVHNLTGESPAWVRFDGSRLPALQGACYVRLEQPDRAEPLLQKALQQSAKTGRRKAMILSDLALSALQQTDVERACTYADEVVTLTSSSSSGSYVITYSR